jgi:hypothetical protein
VRSNDIKHQGIRFVVVWTFFNFNPDVYIIQDSRLDPMIFLLANSLSVLLLIRYRNGDANVRSAWLCSRNDAISNIAYASG